MKNKFNQQQMKGYYNDYWYKITNNGFDEDGDENILIQIYKDNICIYDKWNYCYCGRPYKKYFHRHIKRIHKQICDYIDRRIIPLVNDNQ